MQGRHVRTHVEHLVPALGASLASLAFSSELLLVYPALSRRGAPVLQQPARDLLLARHSCTVSLSRLAAALDVDVLFPLGARSHPVRTCPAWPASTTASSRVVLAPLTPPLPRPRLPRPQLRVSPGGRPRLSTTPHRSRPSPPPSPPPSPLL